MPVRRRTGGGTGASDATLALADALVALRDAAATTMLPLDVPDADAARSTRRTLVEQLEDYLLPRLRRLDAPLLVVVGGSTGAGKSTIVNSLVGATVSPAGVLRPTTRAPVLVCHPVDREAFSDDRVLPRFARVTGSPGAVGTVAPAGERTLRLVSNPSVRAGLALIDAPDLDSVVEANRELANQLLSAADLWLFVTSAARYADAVPWEALCTAADRGTALAIVLDRVPPDAASEIAEDLRRMLDRYGLPGAPLLIVPETALSDDGLLPAIAIAGVRDYLRDLSDDSESRAAIARRTLAGALASLPGRADALASAADAQRRSAGELLDAALESYRIAEMDVAESVRQGTVLRGEVLARWREFVGAGELLRTLETRIGQFRDRMVAAVTGRPRPAEHLTEALGTGLHALVTAGAEAAAERTDSSWRAHPAGAALVREAVDHDLVLRRPTPDLDTQVTRLVRDWQGAVIELVRTEGATRRSVARFAAYGVNVTGLVVMIAVFAQTAFIPTGAEIAVAGGTAVVSQKVLEAVFGDEAVRRLAATAREDLLERVAALYDRELDRFEALLPDLAGGAHLRETVTSLRRFQRRAEREGAW
jgi:energy-coupling factor transporter ATP-binding protein EcfA2